jgi:hypothetical protein
MYTDPAVVRRKVERELREYVERIDHFRARGIWVLEYFFPELLVVFMTTKVPPFPVAPFGVVLNLSNYDVEPPSIRFVNPLTRAPLKASEVPFPFPRFEVVGNVPQPTPAVEAAVEGVPGQAAPPAQPVPQQVQLRHIGNLVQAWGPSDDRPFICLPGVREYHDNPGHTGDPWWLHRASGAGRIVRLLDLLAKYGTEQMGEMVYHVQYQQFHQFQVQPRVGPL